MRRLLITIMLAAAGILTPAAALAGTAHGPAVQRFGVRLVDVPVSEAHNPRALRYIIDYVSPGTVLRRRILVLSEESRKAHLTFYPDAAQITRGFFIGDAGQTRSELTSWISVQHRVLTLRPHGNVMDLVTIRVPRIATRGEHYGVIWAQQVAHARTASGAGISEVTRVGIRIYLFVGRGGVPPTKFAITSVSGSRTGKGQPRIVARVHNTGERAVDLTGTARLTGGPGGTTAGPFGAQQVVTLAPGQSGNVTFLPGSRIPNGPWNARVTLVSGLTTSTASATIQFSGTVAAAAWITRLPVMITVAALVIALLFLARIMLRRRPQARRAHA